MEVEKYRIIQNKLRRRHGKSVMYKRSWTQFRVRQIQRDLSFARLQSVLPRPQKKLQKKIPNEYYKSSKSDGFGKDMFDNNQIESSASKEPIQSTDSLGKKESFPRVIMEQQELILLIRIIALKRCSGVQSELFHVLEEQGLEVLHAHGFYTEDKVFFSIQAVPQSQMDLEFLGEKLYVWAGKCRNGVFHS